MYYADCIASLSLFCTLSMILPFLFSFGWTSLVGSTALIRWVDRRAGNLAVDAISQYPTDASFDYPPITIIFGRSRCHSVL
jgi:hypothetical protein